MASSFDLVFVGGGLASGLAAYRCIKSHPKLRIAIIEKSAHIGGHHTWSFHPADIGLQGIEQDHWLQPFIEHKWPRYDVRFPAFDRSFESGYFSMSSQRFRKVLEKTDIALETGLHVARIRATEIDIEGGGHIQAQCVIDARGWSARTVPCAYQKFVGLVCRVKSRLPLPQHPMIMDASVEQIDGFRFMYVLPFGQGRMLIEDTRFSESPTVDIEDYRRKIGDYAFANLWEIDDVLSEEMGAIPLPIHTYSRPLGLPGVPTIGMRAGAVHATTGYSLLYAVQIAEILAKLDDYDHLNVLSTTNAFADRVWSENTFFRRLNNMLYLAAKPHERLRVLEKFYRLPESTIAHFYSGRLGVGDKARILSGRPPVGLAKGIRAFLSKNTHFPLDQR